jgi:phosphoglycerate dehydrogenase-like enzyme
MQMKPLNILVLVPSFDKATPHADKECLRLIREVSPRIKVKDGSALADMEHKGNNSQKEQLDALLAWTDVIYGLMAPPNTIARAPKLQWIQVISAGVDRWIGTDVWQSPVILTGVSGIHATPIGEYVMALMLMFAKNTPRGFKMMHSRQWRRYRSGTLRNKTVGIVGLGHIGREVARLSKAFGMKTIATRRSTKKPGRARYVDLLLPQAGLKQMLTASDYVAVCVPLTPETRHMIGKIELKSMKPSAFLINIGRGNLIDEKALISALKKKQIAGAGLDVTCTEPLPEDSPLWGFDNVILSPHISGDMEDYMLRATDLFCNNLRRHLSGKKLLNVISRKKGY